MNTSAPSGSTRCVRDKHFVFLVREVHSFHHSIQQGTNINRVLQIVIQLFCATFASRQVENPQDLQVVPGYLARPPYHYVHPETWSYGSLGVGLVKWNCVC